MLATGACAGSDAFFAIVNVSCSPPASYNMTCAVNLQLTFWHGLAMSSCSHIRETPWRLLHVKFILLILVYY